MPRRKKRIIIPELLAKTYSDNSPSVEKKKTQPKKKLDDKLLKFKFLCGG